MLFRYRTFLFLASVFLSLILLAACSGEPNNDKDTVKGPNANRGRKLYLINCIICHNRDPSKDGPTGPAINGSSEALIEAKVLRRAYPSGYAPKRKSTAMPAFPHLKKAIPDISAYLR